jgi:hypothetical protein
MFRPSTGQSGNFLLCDQKTDITWLALEMQSTNSHPHWVQWTIFLILILLVVFVIGRCCSRRVNGNLGQIQSNRQLVDQQQQVVSADSGISNKAIARLNSNIEKLRLAEANANARRAELRQGNSIENNIVTRSNRNNNRSGL